MILTVLVLPSIMSTKLTKSVASIDEGHPIQISVTIGRIDALGVVILVAVLAIILSYIGFSLYKRSRLAQKLALDLFNEANQKILKKFDYISGQLLSSNSKNAQDLSAEVKGISNRLIESNKKAIDALEASQVLPEGHVLVDLTEGSSLHPLPTGYVMKVERKLEHRAVAEAILGRDLAVNEIVHHIYAPNREDNGPENLCVMDRDQHDVFHSYLQREKLVKGRYPSIAIQKRVLKQHFEGLLIDEALDKKNVQFPPIKPLPEKFPSELVS